LLIVEERRSNGGWGEDEDEDPVSIYKTNQGWRRWKTEVGRKKTKKKKLY
jgi:hypothetical protein